MTELVDIRDLDAGVAYPGHLIEGCETALVLFAAGFLGRQDAYWIADAGLRAWCVDTDAAKLTDMAAMYPEDWSFVAADVWWFAEQSRGGRTWDVVSLDPWTQDFQKTADDVGLWCSLAARAVILGTGIGTKVEPPDGWHVTYIARRSDYMGGVYWTVLEPA